MENIQDWEIGDTVVDSENNTLTALPGYVKAAKPTIFWDYSRLLNKAIQ